jgi:oxygen-dependent protoporphyrinogen oxidase
VAERLVSAFVAGVYAADPGEIAIGHAFPRLHALEREHGSVLRGMMHEARAARRRGVARAAPISFAQGMGYLPESMARSLGGAVRWGMALTALERDVTRRWRLHFRCADGRAVTLAAAHVVLAIPAPSLSRLAVPASMRAPLALIGAMPHAAVSVWTMAFRRDEVAHALDGFGVLVPAPERHTVLGVLFASSMFAGRCAPGTVLLSAFVREPAHADATAVREADVCDDLRRILGVTGRPLHLERHAHAGIPLKSGQHGDVLDAAARLEREHDGFTLAGSWRSGVAVGECLVAGARVVAPSLR